MQYPNEDDCGETSGDERQSVTVCQRGPHRRASVDPPERGPEGGPVGVDDCKDAGSADHEGHQSTVPHTYLEHLAAVGRPKQLGQDPELEAVRGGARVRDRLVDHSRRTPDPREPRPLERVDPPIP